MKFQKGQSGNPAGRPKGIKDKRAIWREMLESESEELINKAVQMAKDSDEQMLKFILDRVLPAKPKTNPIEIGEFKGNPEEKSTMIMQAAFKGLITPLDASVLINTLKTHTYMVDMKVIQDKMEELEKLNKPQSSLGSH